MVYIGTIIHMTITTYKKCNKCEGIVTHLLIPLASYILNFDKCLQTSVKHKLSAAYKGPYWSLMIFLHALWPWYIHYVSLVPNTNCPPLPYMYFTYKMFREVSILSFSVYCLSYWHTSYCFWRFSSCHCVAKCIVTDVSEDRSVLTLRVK
jgi:hypothetical protein